MGSRVNPSLHPELKNRVGSLAPLELDRRSCLLSRMQETYSLTALQPISMDIKQPLRMRYRSLLVSCSGRRQKMKVLYGS